MEQPEIGAYDIQQELIYYYLLSFQVFEALFDLFQIRRHRYELLEFVQWELAILAACLIKGVEAQG